MTTEKTHPSQKRLFPDGFRHWLFSPDAHWLMIPLGVFVATRLLMALMIVVGGASLPIDYAGDFYDAAWKSEGFGGLWMRWDSMWYVMIAEDGYEAWYTEDALSAVSWFPAYPMLMRVLSPVFGNPLMAGLVISHACFLAALILLYRLTLMETENPGVAARTVAYLGIFPTTLFFSAAYTESFFLLVTLMAAYAARKQRWWLAGLSGVIAAMTRVPGVFVAVLVGLEWLAAQGWTLRNTFQAGTWRRLWDGFRRQPGAVLAILLIPGGLLVYMGYLHLTFGNALAFLDSTRTDGRGMDGPITGFLSDIRGMFSGTFDYAYNIPVDLLFLGLALLLLIPMARRLRLSYAVYVLLSLIPAMLTGSTRSLTRYTMVLFPMFMLLAMFGNYRRIDFLIRITFIPLACIYAVLFAKWFFVG